MLLIYFREERGAMFIEAKTERGYRVACGCEKTFVVRRLGPSVECPHCGHTALSVDLVTEFAISRGSMEADRAA